MRDLATLCMLSLRPRYDQRASATTVPFTMYIISLQGTRPNLKKKCSYFSTRTYVVGTQKNRLVRLN